MARTTWRLGRVPLVFLILASAAVNVSADDGDDDVDRTDYSDPALTADPVATGPHSEIESAWIMPESMDGKVPVVTGSDLVVALANSGTKMFKVSKIEATLFTKAGKVATKLETVEYAHPLGPGEQRSFRFPVVVDAEMALGEYKLVANAYYTSREKDPFVSLVCDETIELVPQPPNKEDRIRQLQYVIAAVVIAVIAVGGRSMTGGGASNVAKPTKKAPESNGGAAKSGDEWLTGTLAGSENRSPKKKKKA